MDISEIRYFLELGRCLNFSQAAENCSISQSSFSKAIKRLETELNVCLIDRTTHPVTLTEAGSFFFAQMKEMEPLFSETMRNLLEMGNRKVLRLLLCPGAFRVKMAIDEYMQCTQDVRILTEDRSDQSKVLDRMEQDGVDCAITYLPLEGTRGFTATELYTDSLYLVCAKNNPLARKQTVSLKELDGKTLLETGHSGALVKEICHRFGLTQTEVTIMSRGQLKREEAIQRIAMDRGIGIYHGRDLMPYRGFGLHCASIAELPTMPVVFLTKEGVRYEKNVCALRNWLQQNLVRYAQEKMNLEKFNKEG